MTECASREAAAESAPVFTKTSLGNPLKRMRKERRIALLFFNLLLLASALMQLVSWTAQTRKPDAPPPPPAVEMIE